MKSSLLFLFLSLLLLPQQSSADENPDPSLLKKKAIDFDLHVLDMKPKLAAQLIRHIQQRGKPAKNAVSKIPSLISQNIIKRRDSIRDKTKFLTGQEFANIPMGGEKALNGVMLYQTFNLKDDLLFADIKFCLEPNWGLEEKKEVPDLSRLKFERQIYFENGCPTLLHSSEKEGHSRIVLMMARSHASRGKISQKANSIINYRVQIFKVDSKLATHIPGAGQAAYDYLQTKGELVRSDTVYGALMNQDADFSDYADLSLNKSLQSPKTPVTLKAGIDYKTTIHLPQADGSIKTSANWSYVFRRLYEVRNLKIVQIVQASTEYKKSTCQIGKPHIYPAKITVHLGDPKYKETRFYFVFTPFKG